MNLLFVAAVITGICIVVCHQIAKRRGANPVFWGVMAALFGPFAIPFVFMSKAKKEDHSSEF